MGAWELRVSYSGDAVHAPQTHTGWASFQRLATTTTLIRVGTALAVRPAGHPVRPGRAHPLRPGPEQPTTGTVTFKDGTTVLGTAAVAADGTARLAVSSMRLGYRQITATYSGDAGNKPSSAAADHHRLAGDQPGEPDVQRQPVGGRADGRPSGPRSAPTSACPRSAASSSSPGTL